MGKKRTVTMMSLSIVIDGDWTKMRFERDILPVIRRTCTLDGQKYAPEVWVDSIETKEMKVIGK